MLDQIFIKREDIEKEILSSSRHFKIMLLALVMIPIALVVHVTTMFVSIFTIPSSVVDLITFSEKTKQIMRRRKHGIQN